MIGVTALDTGFDAIEDGERRRIDLATANGRPFINSCIGGLTAESSGDTSSELKERYGVFAYVLTTLRTVSEFDSLRLSVDIAGGEGRSEWTGEAVLVWVGNGRQFTTGGSVQAHMEDGLLEVAVVEDASALELVADAVGEQLADSESTHIVRSRTPSMTITVRDPEAVRFSLDGEMLQRRELSLGVRPRTLRLAVGDAYDPDPDPE
jgi:diacylglycerol kinase family enzyme